MAQFCTKCGTPLPEGMSFCTGCGATIGGPSAPAAQAPVAQAPAAAAPSPAPAAPAAAATAASSGSTVVKIVLIVLAVFILLGILSAGACVYFVYRAKQRVNQFEKQVHATFPMPAASREVHTQPVAPAAVPSQEAAPVVNMGAIPIYPGASAKEGGGEMSMGAGAVKVQQYTTGDSVDKVAAFYKDKMGPNAIYTQSGGSALVQVSGSNGVISISIAPDGDTGKTVFTITSIAK